MRCELDWAFRDEDYIKKTIDILQGMDINVERVVVSDEGMDVFYIELSDLSKIVEIYTALSGKLEGHPAFPETVGLVIEPSEYHGFMDTVLCLTVYNGYLD